MTTEREMLEFAAKACGIEVVWQEEFGMCLIGEYLKNPGEVPRFWNPLTNSADFAAMCAKLSIDTIWYKTMVECASSEHETFAAMYSQFNDREAAWCYAATMVATKIEGMK